jgi:hypothetical protein
MNLFLDESLEIDKKGRKRKENKEPGNRSPSLLAEVVGYPGEGNTNEDGRDKKSNEYLEHFRISAKLSRKGKNNIYENKGEIDLSRKACCTQKCHKIRHIFYLKILFCYASSITYQ